MKTLSIHYIYEVCHGMTVHGSLRTVAFVIERTVVQFDSHKVPFAFRHYVASRQFILRNEAIQWAFNECLRRCE